MLRLRLRLRLRSVVRRPLPVWELDHQEEACKGRVLPSARLPEADTDGQTDRDAGRGRDLNRHGVGRGGLGSQSSAGAVSTDRPNTELPTAQTRPKGSRESEPRTEPLHSQVLCRDGLLKGCIVHRDRASRKHATHETKQFANTMHHCDAENCLSILGRRHGSFPHGRSGHRVVGCELQAWECTAIPQDFCCLWQRLKPVECTSRAPD